MPSPLVRKSTSEGEEGSKTRVCTECPDDLHLFRISFWADFIFSLLDAQNCRDFSQHFPVLLVA